MVVAAEPESSQRAEASSSVQHQVAALQAGPAVGDVVAGRVVWSTAKGAKVQLLDFPGAIAYMPVREGPFAIRDVHEDNLWANGAVQGPCLPKGLIREFQVVSLPSPASGAKQGPLLSARLVDLDRLWSRAQQLLNISAQGRENFTVQVESVNSGGLVSRLTGLSLFIPVSQLPKRKQGEWWTESTMRDEYVGKHVSVAVMEVARATRKVVCSMLRAEENGALRGLQVGSLISGTVRRVEPFGVFVGLDGTRTSGLLHISNVSRQHIDQAAFVNSVFSAGDRVRCLVMGLDPDYSNISLSTAELEPADGDMLADKQRVWDAAEEEAAAFREHLENLKASGFDFAAFAAEAAAEGLK